MFKKLIDKANKLVEESREIVAAKIDEVVRDVENATNLALDAVEEAADKYRPIIERTVVSAIKTAEDIENGLRSKFNSATSVPPTAPEIQPKPVVAPPVGEAAPQKKATVKKPAAVKTPSKTKAKVKKPAAKRPAVQNPTVRKGRPHG